METVVDAMKVDAYHYFVPVTFTDGRNGMSFWKWAKGEWQLVQLTGHQLLRWQLDDNDKASNYIVWHRQPGEKEMLSIYLTRKRNFHIQDTNQHYTPKIQLQHDIEIGSYGVEAIPIEWATIMMATDVSVAPMKWSLFVELQQDHYIFSVKFEPSSAFLYNVSRYIYNTGHADSTITFLYPIYEEQLE